MMVVRHHLVTFLRDRPKTASRNATARRQRTASPGRAALHCGQPLPITSNSESGFSFLAHNDAAQDERFRDAFAILDRAIGNRAFPACSVAITLGGELIAQKALGHFTYEISSPEVSNGTIFDLASLTKVVATTSMAMILYERGVLDLEAPVVAIIPEFGAADARRAQVTLRMLLAHSSGLPAYEKLFLRAHNSR